MSNRCTLTATAIVLLATAMGIAVEPATAPKPTAERIKLVRAMYEKLPGDILGYAEPFKLQPGIWRDFNGEAQAIILLDSNGKEMAIEMDNETRVFSISTKRSYFGVTPGVPKEGNGVLLAEILPDSPAAAAGLKAGDVVTQMNSDAVKNFEQFRQLLSARKPGDKVAVAIQRDGQGQTVGVTLGWTSSGAFGLKPRLPLRGPEESAVYGVLLCLPADDRKGAEYFLEILDERFAGAMPETDK